MSCRVSRIGILCFLVASLTLSAQERIIIVRDDPDEWWRRVGMLPFKQGSKFGFVAYSNPDRGLTPALYDDYCILRNSFKDGLVGVMVENDMGPDFWGFINFQGQEVIPCKYQIELAGTYQISDHLFDNGMVVMSIKYEVYGAFDKSGNIVIPFEYDDIQPFMGGIMTLCKNGQYAAVNKDMEIIIPYRYTKLYYFGNHRFVAAKDGKYGVINEQEEVLIPFEFKWISADWRRGWAYATLPDGTDVAIDSRGNLIDK